LTEPLYECTECDRMLTRCAHLAKAVKLAGEWAHHHQDHQGDWRRCKQEPCVTLNHQLQYAGIE
jgi:hypothetical protein